MVIFTTTDLRIHKSRVGLFYMHCQCTHATCHLHLSMYTCHMSSALLMYTCHMHCQCTHVTCHLHCQCTHATCHLHLSMYTCHMSSTLVNVHMPHVICTVNVHMSCALSMYVCHVHMSILLYIVVMNGQEIVLRCSLVCSLLTILNVKV